jgi:aquaporin Z
MEFSSGQKYLAEFLGTFALLLFGGGAAVFSASAFSPGLAIGNARVVLVSAAFGLTVVGAAYAFGEISGGHFNPAVTLSMAANRRMPGRDVVPYIVSQVAGGIVGMLLVYGISKGSSTADLAASLNALASQCYNGLGAPAGCGFTAPAVFLVEAAVTFVFVLVIQMVTRAESGAKNLAPLAIGLSLMVTNLIAINVDGASINPARSFAPAVVALAYGSSDYWAIEQSWIFWVAPIVGGLLAAAVAQALKARSE